MSQEEVAVVEQPAELNFKESHKAVKKRLEELLKLIEALHKSPNGKIEATNGTTISTKDFHRYKAAFFSEYNKLLTVHSLTTKTKRSKNRNGPKSKNNKNPMFAPMFVNKLIVDYFAGIDLGPAFKITNSDVASEELDANGEPVTDQQLEFEDCNKELKKCLDLFLTQRITSCASLTPLFILVTRRLKLQDQKNKQYVVPDDRFKKFFGSIFQKVVEEQVARLKQLKADLATCTDPDDKKNLQQDIVKLEKNPLDPNKFRLVRFQTIVSHCREKELTDEQREKLKDKDIVSKIEEEQKIISDSLKYDKYNDVASE